MNIAEILKDAPEGTKLYSPLQMKVRIKKLHPEAVLPKKAHNTDAGFDLTATNYYIDNNGNVVYGTGLAFEIPKGFAGFVFCRSSVSNYNLSQANCVGVIDSGYRGEVTVKFKPTLEFMRNDDPGYIGYRNPRYYRLGERIAQLVILPLPDIEFIEADTLEDSDRGTGGYGSTGK